MMAVDLMIICVAVLVATALVKRTGARRELARHTITPDDLSGTTGQSQLFSTDFNFVTDKQVL